MKFEHKMRVLGYVWKISADLLIGKLANLSNYC